jgi:hypothetical protein
MRNSRDLARFVGSFELTRKRVIREVTSTPRQQRSDTNFRSTSELSAGRRRVGDAYALLWQLQSMEMNDNADFIAKLQQIEELANALGAELGAQLAKTRARHIAILARSLRGRLEFGNLSVSPSEARDRTRGPETKPPR